MRLEIWQIFLNGASDIFWLKIILQVCHAVLWLVIAVNPVKRLTRPFKKKKKRLILINKNTIKNASYMNKVALEI